MSESPAGRSHARPRHRRRGLDTGVKVALAALLVGAVAFCVVVAAGYLGQEEKGESLTAATVQAGQCVDIAEAAGRIDLTEAPCDRAHDAEVVLTTQVRDAYQADVDLGDPEAACRGLLDADAVARLDDAGVEIGWGLLIDEPSNIDPFDRLVCYVEAAEGELDVQLLG